jgi:simple sugar transport system permease protein
VAKKFSYKIEKRQNVGILVDLVSIVVALLASIAVASVIISNSGADAKTVLWAIVKGSFGSTTAIVETLNRATPILFTGLATVIAYRAKVWNIGQEGQLYAGAMAMTFVILAFPNTQLPAVIYVPLLLIVAILGGIIWGSIPGILKAKYNVNEIIVTVMLNYIIMYICTFLLNGVWQEPGSFYYNTIPFPESSNSPLLFGTKLHIGFPLALLLAVVVSVM